MKPMNTQEIFTHVKEHLLKQGVKSNQERHGVVKCLYRDECGNSCAVGSLIKDEFYSKYFEYTNLLPESYEDICRVHGEASRHATLRKALEDSIGTIGRQDVMLLAELQRIHDVYGIDDWEDALKHKAKQRELVY